MVAGYSGGKRVKAHSILLVLKAGKNKLAVKGTSRYSDGSYTGGSELLKYCSIEHSQYISNTHVLKSHSETGFQ